MLTLPAEEVEARAVTCAACDAAPGQPCVYPSWYGGPVLYSHEVRWVAAAGCRFTWRRGYGAIAHRHQCALPAVDEHAHCCWCWEIYKPKEEG